jgi:hypothetical protein
MSNSPQRLPFTSTLSAHRSYRGPDRHEFVPNRQADYVNIFDLSEGKFAKKIQVGRRPDVTATTIDGRYLYVAGEYLAIIDLKTLNVIRTLTGEGIRALCLEYLPRRAAHVFFNYDGSIGLE